jgi:hypothetical protein
MSDNDQAQELGRKLGGLFKGGGTNARHKPIVKALEELGIDYKVMPVMIGDEPIDCVVIPAQELLVKEYAAMTGVDPNILLGDKTPPEEPKPRKRPAKKATPKVEPKEASDE